MLAFLFVLYDNRYIVKQGLKLMRNHQLTFKNKQTGARETISQQGLEHVGWGFHFFVDNEAEAYKAGYQYRNSPHGFAVEFAKGIGQWMVTVFNEKAVSLGLDGAK